MPTYRYAARTRTGLTERGSVDAPTEDEAVLALQGRDLLILSLHPLPPPAAGRTAPPAAGRRAARPTRIRSTDLIAFSRAISTMLDAGLPLLRSLETVSLQLRARPLQTAVRDIIQDVRGGSTFRDAVARHPKVFSKLWVSLIETGEASGQLTKVLEQITLHLEKTSAARRKVVSALVYPAILVTVALAAILVFLLKIIPTFSALFQNLHATLPWLTRMIIRISTLTTTYAPAGLLLLLALGVLLWRYLHTEVGRWQFDGLLLKLPIVGPLVQGAAMASFAMSLGTMIKAGVPLLHGLEITIAASTNARVAHVLEAMRAGAREGRPLADPLQVSEVFPPMVSQMIMVGEETGKLAGMLDEIAKFYDEQVSLLLERLTSLLEPALLILMGTVIGTLVVAMYLPIFQLSQAVRG